MVFLAYESTPPGSFADAALRIISVASTPPPPLTGMAHDAKPWWWLTTLYAALYYYPGPSINTAHCLEDSFEQWWWNEYALEYEILVDNYPIRCYVPADYL